MSVDLDTFLVALYTIVDDLYRAYLAPAKPRRPGKRPALSDSEVLTLLVCAQWLGGSERALGRYAATYWRAYFPRLLDQSAYNRRVRDLAGALVRLVPRVAGELGAALTPYQAFDGVPVPLARRCRGQRHRLFGDEAAIGKGGSDRAWYYGCQLLVACTAEGVITGFVLGPADTAGHWLAEALLCWRDDPAAAPGGPPTRPGPIGGAATAARPGRSGRAPAPAPRARPPTSPTAASAAPAGRPTGPPTTARGSSRPPATPATPTRRAASTPAGAR